MTRPLNKPLYDNIVLVAPDGEPLCRCNRDKADWYLKRDLAEVASDNPTIIRLKFKPKGRGNAGDDFYLAERRNVCAVCGTDEEQTRHHIVPYCFRRYFTDALKSHNSHDIVPLCVPCHDRYEVHADELKRAIGVKYGVNYGGNTVDVDAALGRVKRHATALLMYRDRIPPTRLGLLTQTLREHYGRDEITDQDIAAAAQIDPAAGTSTRRKFGEVVMGKVKNLERFVRMWRKHFVATMEPKFMPPHWDMNRTTVHN